VRAHGGAVLYAPRPVRPPSRPSKSLRALFRPALALVIAVVGAGLAGSTAGCAPRIGDGCQNNTNCSINGDRLCDNAQPGGSCIVFDCQPDRCPDDAVCVRFNPTPPRLQVVACMRRCTSDADCRSGDGYRCRSAADFAGTDLEVSVLDLDPPDGSFCVAVTDE
jgi:hypothetical protein